MAQTPPRFTPRWRCERTWLALCRISSYRCNRGSHKVDGAYFGGYVKPANLREDRKDRRFRVNASSFDVNPGRANEVLKEELHAGSRQAALGQRSA